MVALITKDAIDQETRTLLKDHSSSAYVNQNKLLSFMRKNRRLLAIKKHGNEKERGLYLWSHCPPVSWRSLPAFAQDVEHWEIKKYRITEILGIRDHTVASWPRANTSNRVGAQLPRSVSHSPELLTFQNPGLGGFEARTHNYQFSSGGFKTRVVKTKGLRPSRTQKGKKYLRGKIILLNIKTLPKCP